MTQAVQMGHLEIHLCCQQDTFCLAVLLHIESSTLRVEHEVPMMNGLQKPNLPYSKVTILRSSSYAI